MKKIYKHFVWILILSIFVLSACNKTEEVVDGDANQVVEQSDLYPVENISHAHGLAVDMADSSKVYVATHEGLFVMIDEKDFYRIGEAQDDYMGFSVHPSEAKVFYSSGHPHTGGNIGVQKSEDRGVSWDKISNGIGGPVDFHAMTISPKNPEILFGWYRNGLQKSSDGGENWEIVAANLPHIISLVGDNEDENLLYAGTVAGLLQSNDQGKTWEVLSEDLKDSAVVTMAIDPTNNQKMLSFSEKLGLAKSMEKGKTWEKISGFDGGVVMFIAFDKNVKDKVYLINDNNIIYKSVDGGETWISVN